LYLIRAGVRNRAALRTPLGQGKIKVHFHSPVSFLIFPGRPSMYRTFKFPGIIVVALLLTGCGNPTPPHKAITANVDGQTLRVSQPYAHENLTIFLLHSDRQDERAFVTLDDGLRQGLVKVAEQPEEQVGKLELVNDSDRPLFLQEGERLQGGKQDRTIIASMVIPPHSGKVVVPTFCVEQSRWTEGKTGKQFGYTANSALAPKGVRGSAKFDKSQQKVWSCVGVQKKNVSASLATPNTTSSLNETLDAGEVQRLSSEYEDAFTRIVGEHPDAIGMAIVFNGTIEEVNIYPNHAVFEKLFPRLIRSYALYATMLKEEKAGQALAAGAIADFLEDGDAKSKREDKIDAHNVLELRELEGNKFSSAARFDGGLVHWQMMQKNAAGTSERETARFMALGACW
jgi:hypothetical protein